MWPTDGPAAEVSPSHQLQSGLPSGGKGNGLVSALDSEAVPSAAAHQSALLHQGDTLQSVGVLTSLNTINLDIRRKASQDIIREKLAQRQGRQYINSSNLHESNLPQREPFMYDTSQMTMSELS